MKKVGSSQEQKNFSKETETLGKSQMKILEIVLKYSNNKNIISEIILVGSPADWTAKQRIRNSKTVEIIQTEI